MPTCARCARSARPVALAADAMSGSAGRAPARDDLAGPDLGGTDIAGAFVGGMRRCRWCRARCRRCLGAAVEAWNEPGERLIDEVGELVCTNRCRRCRSILERRRRPPLSRQLLRHVSRRLAARRLDPHHAARRRDHLRPQRRDHQPARHPHGHRRAVSRGRGGARSLDSLVVDLEYLGRESYMPLFVVLRDGRRSMPRC